MSPCKRYNIFGIGTLIVCLSEVKIAWWHRVTSFPSVCHLITPIYTKIGIRGLLSETIAAARRDGRCFDSQGETASESGRLLTKLSCHPPPKKQFQEWPMLFLENDRTMPGYQSTFSETNKGYHLWVSIRFQGNTFIQISTWLACNLID